MIDEAEVLSGTDRKSLRCVAVTVRTAFAGQPDFPHSYCHDASVALVMVLERLGIAAWPVRGRVRLDQGIPLDDEEPETVYVEFTHWWVESCGYWIDLTYDHFRDGLHDQPAPGSIWASGESSRHIPGNDDPSEANRHETKMRKNKRVRQVVEQVVKHWKEAARP